MRCKLVPLADLLECITPPKNDGPSKHSDNVEGYALRDQLKIAAGVSTFAKSFTDYQSASQDVSILTRLSDAEGRVFSNFPSDGHY